MNKKDIKIKILKEKLEEATGKKVVLKEVSKLSEVIKSYPYRVSLFKNDLSPGKVIEFFNLKLHSKNHTGIEGISGIYETLYFSSDKKVALYEYTSSGRIQDTLGFKDRKQFLKFKETIKDFEVDFFDFYARD